jgi:excisionase family DNA binding protein
MQNEAKLTYNVEEAAKLLGLSRGTAYALCKNNKIPTLHLGKRLLIPKIALERMLSGNGKGGQDASH